MSTMTNLGPAIRRRGPWRGRLGAVAVSGLIALAALASFGCAAGGERVVHHERGDHYAVWVIEEDGVRFLRFAREGINQSAVKLGEPTYMHFVYTKAMVPAIALRPDARNVLVVGLGGGTLPMYVRSVMPNAVVDVVEIDALVRDAAVAHMGLRLDDKLRVHIADGRRFVEQTKTRYDLILLDAYGASEIPQHLATREFLTAVRARLTDRGVVASNVWSEDANTLYPSMLRTHEDVFGRVSVIRGFESASRIVIAGPAPLTKAALLDASGRFARTHKPDFDIEKIVERGWATTPLKGGGVLTDANLLR